MDVTSSTEVPAQVEARPCKGAAVVLFDGECALCQGSVKELLREDREGVLSYAPLQGATAREVLARHGEDAQSLSGMWLVENWGTEDERLSHRSDAVLRIGHLIGRGRFGLARGLGWVPRFLREGGYEVVARSRYLVFGKADASCSLGTPKQRARIFS